MEITNNKTALNPKFLKALKQANENFVDGMPTKMFGDKYRTISELDKASKAVEYSQIDLACSKLSRDKELARKLEMVQLSQEQGLEALNALRNEINQIYWNNQIALDSPLANADQYLKRIADILNMKVGDLSVWGGNSPDMQPVAMEDILISNNVDGVPTSNYTKIKPGDDIECGGCKIKLPDATHIAFQQLIGALNVLKDASDEQQRLAAIQTLVKSDASADILGADIANNGKLLKASEAMMDSLELNLSQIITENYHRSPAMINLEQQERESAMRVLTYSLMEYSRVEREAIRTLCQS